MPVIYGSKIDTMTPVLSNEIGRLEPLASAPKTIDWWSAFNPINWIKDIAVGLYDVVKEIATFHFLSDLTPDKIQHTFTTIGQIGITFIPVVGPIASGIWQASNAIKQAVDNKNVTSGDVASLLTAGFSVFHGVRTGLKNVNFVKGIDTANIRYTEQIDKFKSQVPMGPEQGSLWQAIQTITNQSSPLVKANNIFGEKVNAFQYLENSELSPIKRLLQKPKSQFESIKSNAISGIEKRFNDMRDSLLEQGQLDAYSMHYPISTIDAIESINIGDINQISDFISKNSTIEDLAVDISEFHEKFSRLYEIIKNLKKLGLSADDALTKALASTEGKTLWARLTTEEQAKFILFARFGETSKLSKIASDTLNKTQIAKLSKKTVGVTNKVLKGISSPQYLAHKIFDESFAKLFEPIAELGEKIRKGIKVTKAVEDSFAKVGGILVNSKWLLGYRIIESDPTGHMIQIAFKPTETYTIAQPEGKLPIYTKVTEAELVEFASSKSKGRHYLDNYAIGTTGRKKKEGKGTDLTESGLDAGILSMLSILPLQHLKNIITIIKTAEDIKSGKGMFGDLDGFVKKFETSFAGEFQDETKKTIAKLVGGHNRVGRSIARQALGGKSVGKILSSQAKSHYTRSIRRSQSSGTRKGVSSVKKIARLQSSVTKLF